MNKQLNLFSTNETAGIAGNLVFAIVAQGVGLVSSFLTSLVLPRFLGVEDYAYWQLFLLYSSYSGFALLGLNDGLYLRLGGKRYSDLAYDELKAQQLVVFLSQVAVAIGCLFAICMADVDSHRMTVYLLVVAMGLTTNLTQCLRYVFQCTNLTRISSIADLITKACFLLCMGVLLIFGVRISLPFIVSYLICQGLAFFYVLICARNLFAANSCFSGVISTCQADIRAGLKIMIAYYADSLIVGFTRMFTEWELGLAVFGRLSLSFSLTNFVLGFIGQVSMVAFPVLKRMDAVEQRNKYIEIRSLLHIVLPMTYLLYVPMKVLLGFWLPSYEKSFVYLALTMPLCIYSCKANFLFNTYMKMGRYEGYLCVINIGAMLLNVGFAFIGIHVFSSVEIATCGIIATVVLRDLTFEGFMARIYHDPYVGSCLSEALITACFMLASWTLGLYSFPIVIFILFGYLFVSKNELRLVASMVREKFCAGVAR